MGDGVGGNSRMLARTRDQEIWFFRACWAAVVSRRRKMAGAYLATRWLTCLLLMLLIGFYLFTQTCGRWRLSFSIHLPTFFFLFSFTAHLVVSSICASVSGATPPGYDFYYRWEMSWAEPTDDTKKHRSSDELLLVLRICLKNVRAFQFVSFFFIF